MTTSVATVASPTAASIAAITSSTCPAGSAAVVRNSTIISQLAGTLNV